MVTMKVYGSRIVLHRDFIVDDGIGYRPIIWARSPTSRPDSWARINRPPHNAISFQQTIVLP